MLLRKLIMTYGIVCDKCGATADFSRDDDDAKSAAIEAGFTHYDWYNGLEYIHRDYCPTCESELTDSERERMGRRPARAIHDTRQEAFL